MVAATIPTNEFCLRYLANEDEAQMTGYRFVVKGRMVEVWPTYHFPEYGDSRPLHVMTKDAARKFWRELVGTYEFIPA